MPLRSFAIFYVLSAWLTSSYAKSVTLNFTNPAIRYSPHWTVPSHPDHAVLNGNPSFAASAQVGAYLSVNFPDHTVSAEYVGFRQRDGSAYGVCLDCDTDAGSLTIIDGHDSPSTNTAQPVVLFSAVDLRPNTSHTLMVFNLPDNRFAKRSKITFHSIVLDVDDSSNSGVANSAAGSTDHSASNQTNNAANNVDGGNTNPTVTNIESSSIFPLPSQGVTLTIVQPLPSITPTAVTTTGVAPTSTTSLPADDSEAPSPTLSQSTTSVETTSPATEQRTASVETTSSATEQHATAPAPSPSNSIDNGSNTNQSESASGVSSKTASTSLIAIIAVLSSLAVLSLLVGLFFFLRRRKRAQQSITRLPDTETDSNNAAPSIIGAPVIVHQSGGAGGGVPPVRPRNPFEDSAPANEPLDGNLDLEYPSDSSLMKKRRRPRTTSSFGNLVLDTRTAGSSNVGPGAGVRS